MQNRNAIKNEFLISGKKLKAKSLFVVIGLLLIFFAVAFYIRSSRQVTVSPSENSLRLQSANDKRSLTVKEKHVVVAQKGSQLIILLDLNQNRTELEASGENAKEIVIATASYHARQNLLKPEFQFANSAVVLIVFVESMDEYNRADYGGMKRFGTITFSKVGSEVSMSENNLTKIP